MNIRDLFWTKKETQDEAFEGAESDEGAELEDASEDESETSSAEDTPEEEAKRSNVRKVKRGGSCCQ